MDSGVKLLSNINIGMAVVETFGLYITNLLPMAFWNSTLLQRRWHSLP
ncbi:MULTISPECIES: hypothetical protein [unclassified Halomonas]